jgi:apolipoprotein N-acyltransferase
LEGNATKAPFRNTAFVVAPSGEVTFTQVKSVPIQFFQDGLPALTQKVWESPWGRLGVAVCYDASYRRVMDVLVTQGAQALVVPAMDVEQWGRAQHELNARAMRVRCQEYGLPALRIASSGFSQLINPSGLEIARTSFPGQDEILAGELKIVGGGKIPLDRFLVLPTMVATTLIVVFLIGLNIRRSKWLSGTHTSTIS